MCLGIPGRVVETWRDHDILMGKVDFNGVMKRVWPSRFLIDMPSEGGISGRLPPPRRLDAVRRYVSCRRVRAPRRSRRWR